ncbi:MAG: GNAT family N-acetyltransferase [Pseudomonadota bacterium]
MSGNYSIRRAGAADVCAVRALTRAAYAKWLPVIGREPLPMGADYEIAVREHLIDLLFKGDDLVGLAEMIPGRDHIFVANVAVTPNLHGRGLGHILMEHIERITEQFGYSEIRLCTHNLFEENIRLYLKLGYKIVSEDKIADGFRVNMSKVLKLTQ